MQVVKLTEEITKEADIRTKEVKTNKRFSQLKEPGLRLKSESDWGSQQSESEWKEVVCDSLMTPQDKALIPIFNNNQ